MTAAKRTNDFVKEEMNLVEQLKRDEGLRLTPYRDIVGKLTIGYGRNLDDAGISTDEAEYMLANDIANARISVAKAIPWMTSLCEPRQSVLINMAFNMGIAGLLGFKHTLQLIQANEFDMAAEAMLESKWAKQVGPRAHRLALQMRSGEWQ